MIAVITALLVKELFVGPDVVSTLLSADRSSFLQLIFTVFFDWFNSFKLSMCMGLWCTAVDKRQGFDAEHDRYADQDNDNKNLRDNDLIRNEALHYSLWIFTWITTIEEVVDHDSND